MSQPKNQHIIPQCYLKQFVDAKTPLGHEPYVWIFERDTKIGKKKAPKNILAETDFYTLGGNYSIENSLAQIEGQYSLIFEKKIRNKIPLDPHEHIIFCVFVAAMLQRTSKQKEHIENQVDQIISWAKQLEMVHSAEPKPSLAWEAAKKDAHKISVIEMVPKITKILSKMNLAFFCTKNKRVSFITSDSPVYLFNGQMQFQQFPPAFGQKHVEVRMPLSPEISVCFSWINNLRGYLVATEDIVHNDNRMVYGHSHQYFIGNSEKVKWRWFRRLPLDPIFLWSFLKNKIPMWISMLRNRKYYDRSRKTK
ncbi:MAG: DUF4238 domain-containing protein [Candidatus Gracilibacteria bacterium]|jgi:hypothetical protein